MNFSVKRSKLIFLAFAITAVTACKKDKDDDGPGNPSGGGGNSELVIENGSQVIKSEESIIYTARLVDQNGNSSTASNVSWSTSDQAVATIDGNGALTVVSEGIVNISAEVTVDGNKKKATVPLSIVSAQAVFTVTPGAIVWTTGAGTIPLIPVYFGNENATYTYSSSDQNVVTVSGSGEVSFIAGGSAVITVTSSVSGNPSVKVPVLVVGKPSVPLPVARVEIFNSKNEKSLAHKMFRNQSEQFSAKAYNSNGAEVSADFAWSVEDVELVDVDATGKLSSRSETGRTTLRATAQGISGQTEVLIYPDSVIFVDPFYKSAVTAGSTHQLTPILFRVDKTTFELDPVPLQNPASGIVWEVIPTKVDIFNPTVLIAPATVNSSGFVTVKNDATFGDLVITIAFLPGSQAEPGVSTFTVGF